MFLPSTGQLEHFWFCSFRFAFELDPGITAYSKKCIRISSSSLSLIFWVVGLTEKQWLNMEYE